MKAVTTISDVEIHEAVLHELVWDPRVDAALVG
jgi:hypothetical protein